MWITFHLAMGKKPHDQLLFLPYSCLAFRLLRSQTSKLEHRLVRSQNWVWHRLVQKAGMETKIIAFPISTDVGIS